MKYLLAFLWGVISLELHAQSVCDAVEYRHFDFWIGDWEVTDTLGNRLGENTILKLEDGCLLQENWVGQSGSTGKSFNYYDANDSTWNQLWVDNQGNHLKLKGGIVQKGVLSLKSESFRTATGNLNYNQITWTQLEDGTVSQVWDILDELGEVERTIFYGIYKRRD